MSLIMGPIRLEQLKLFALELGNISAFNFVYSIAPTNCTYKYKPISTKLGRNIYKISDEFDYGSSHTRSVSVICL